MTREFISAAAGMTRHLAGHAVLYHAAWPEPPAPIRRGLHNVSPEEMRCQLRWLRSRFEILTADEFCDTRNPKGKACVTFDDAYLSVFSHALPVLEELEIPATVFVCGVTLTGGEFWRDKLRRLISGENLPKFIAFLESRDFSPHMGEADFYRRSKQPDVSSRLLDEALDAFDALEARSRRAASPVAPGYAPGGVTGRADEAEYPAAGNAHFPEPSGGVPSPGYGRVGERTGAEVPDPTEPDDAAGAAVPPEQDGAVSRLFTAGHPADLPDHPLVSYGNHTWNHYVLSSLTPEEQEREIMATEELLDRMGKRRSRVLAVPFGSEADVTDETFAILRSAGVKAAFRSRARLDFSRREKSGLPVAERYMAPPTLRAMQDAVVRMGYVHPLRRLTGI